MTYQLSQDAGHVYLWTDGVRATIPLASAPEFPLSPDAVAYRQVHGLLTGTRQRIEDQIEAVADDAVALSQIDVAAGWPAAPV